MAARKRKIAHDDATRAKIQTSQLLNRLTDHVFGRVELNQSQVAAANILLKKSLPDLTQSDVNLGGNITVNVVKRGN